MDTRKPVETQQGLSFDPVLPPCGEPYGVVRGEDGSAYIQIKAEQARYVEIRTEEEALPCEKQQEGVWSVRLPFDSGVHFVQLVVDGMEIVSPYLPVAYGYSRICNYVELGNDGEDFWEIKEVPHGCVRKEIYDSSVTGTWEACMVYTPPCYDARPEERFPVLYLQHGHGDNENAWIHIGKVNLIMDNLLAQGKAVPFVIVMNNGMVQRVQENGERIVDYLLLEKRMMEDVIPFIEKNYRVYKDKEHRAMAGLSMGSIQTAMTGFAHPECFSSLGIFSGFLHNFIQGSELDMVKREKSSDRHLELLDDRERFQKEFPVFFRAIGDQDAFLEHFLEDDQLCEEKQIPQIRRIYHGKHDWNVWRRCIYDFAQLLFWQ